MRHYRKFVLYIKSALYARSIEKTKANSTGNDRDQASPLIIPYSSHHRTPSPISDRVYGAGRSSTVRRARCSFEADVLDLASCLRRSCCKLLSE